MSAGTTNIDDLPNSSNIKMDIQEQPAQPQPQGQNIPAVQQTQLSQEDLNKIISGIQSASTNNMTSLPSRDIPTNQNQITQDPQIQANYVPQEQVNNNYIQNEDNIEEMIERNKVNKMKKEKVDSLQDELQTPILIIILFFLFQLPIINKQLFTYIPSLFIKDGNMNFIGYLVKSLLFGGVYYGIIKLVNYIE
jgi:hypothetical protein